MSALIAGKTYGVAKNASIKMAQVFKCGELAAISDSVNAIEWIVKNHQKPAILNLSFGTFIEDGPSDAYGMSSAFYKKFTIFTRFISFCHSQTKPSEPPWMLA